MGLIPKKINLDECEDLYLNFFKSEKMQIGYCGSLRRHIKDRDYRLLNLQFDNSAAAFRLWNFLLTEEERLHEARAKGKKIVGVMKDLGTVPVMAFSLPDVVAFYPDGAWWTPCIMEMNDGLFSIADSLGIDESFCPVRAMLGAFVNCEHFPIPDILICSVGATCDDFSAIAQRLNNLGHEIMWWEMPHRRHPDSDEEAVRLPGGFIAPKIQIDFVQSELMRVKEILENLSGTPLTDNLLSQGIRRANQVRMLLGELRLLVFTSPICPLPALEMQIAEMLAIHFCSDLDETIYVLQDLLDEVQNRIESGMGVLDAGAVKVFWVNPVADLRAMNLLEDCGGRICGTDYLFAHALDLIPEKVWSSLFRAFLDLPPMEALAMMALADPMVGSSTDRAARIISDIKKFGAEALLISRIPGASHCAFECEIIRDHVSSRLDIPIAEIEVPPIIDSIDINIKTRIEALIESVKERRKK